MIIVINISAIIILLIILTITFLLKSIFPEFAEISQPYFWLTFYVISGLTELTKFKGRIFWIPLWLIGIIGFGISSYYEYQKTNSLTGIIVLAILFIIGFFAMKMINKYQWNNAQKYLKEMSRLNPNFDQNSKYRYYMKKAFFIPQYLNPDNNLQYMIFGKFYNKLYRNWFSKPEINSHYLKIISRLKELIPEDLYNAKISMFQSSLMKLKEGKKGYIEQYMMENIKLIIDKYSGHNKR